MEGTSRAPREKLGGASVRFNFHLRAGRIDGNPPLQSGVTTFPFPPFLCPGKIFSLVAPLLVFVGCLLFPGFAHAESVENDAAANHHAIVISIDELPPELYLHPDNHGLKIPHIRRLKTEGCYAEAVEGVYPSATYPSHTTLVTGRWPREHGVYTNFFSREAGKSGPPTGTGSPMPSTFLRSGTGPARWA